MGSSAIANSPLDTAGASGSSPAVVPDVIIEKSGNDQGPSEVGPGPSGTENGSNGLENRRVSQQGGPGASRLWLYAIRLRSTEISSSQRTLQGLPRQH